MWGREGIRAHGLASHSVWISIGGFTSSFCRWPDVGGGAAEAGAPRTARDDSVEWRGGHPGQRREAGPLSHRRQGIVRRDDLTPEGRAPVGGRQLQGPAEQRRGAGLVGQGVAPRRAAAAPDLDDGDRGGLGIGPRRVVEPARRRLAAPQRLLDVRRRGAVLAQADPRAPRPP